jgi:hypothetical protein
MLVAVDIGCGAQCSIAVDSTLEVVTKDEAVQFASEVDVVM